MHSLLSRECKKGGVGPSLTLWPGIGLALFFFIVFSLNINFYYPWVSFYGEWLVFFSLAILCLVVGPRLPFALWMVSVFFFGRIWLIDWGVLGVAWQDTLVYAAYVCLLTMAVSLGVHARRNSVHFFDAVVIAILLTALLSACVVLLQIFNISSQFVVRNASLVRYGGNFSQPNNLATFVLMGYLAFLYIAQNSRLSFFTINFVGVVLIAVVAASQSRTALLSFVALATCASVFKKYPFFAKALPFVLGHFVIFSALFVFFPSFINELYQLDQQVTARELNSPARIQLWQASISAIFQAPWLGYGLHQVGPVLAERAFAEPPGIYAEYAHNVLLDVAIWWGLPVALCLAIFFALVWLRSARHLSDQRIALSAVILIPFGIHSMLEFPFAYSYFLFPAGFFFGCLFCVGGASTNWLDFPRKFSRALGGIGIALLIFVLLEYLQIEERHRELRFKSANIFYVAPEESIVKPWVTSHLHKFVDFALKPASPDISGEEVQGMREVVFRFAYPPTLFRYTLALVYVGEYDEALRTLQRLKGLHGVRHHNEAMEHLRAMAQENESIQRFMERFGHSVSDFNFR